MVGPRNFRERCHYHFQSQKVRFIHICHLWRQIKKVSVKIKFQFLWHRNGSYRHDWKTISDRIGIGKCIVWLRFRFMRDWGKSLIWADTCRPHNNALTTLNRFQQLLWHSNDLTCVLCVTWFFTFNAVEKQIAEMNWPELPPDVVHLAGISWSIEQGPSVLVNGVAERKECELEESINNISRIVEIRVDCAPLQLCVVIHRFRCTFVWIREKTKTNSKFFSPSFDYKGVKLT